MNVFQDQGRRSMSTCWDATAASASASTIATASATATATATNPPTHLRPLPGYTVPSSALSTPAQSLTHTHAHTQAQAQAQSQVPASSLRYQNRERLYYEPVSSRSFAQLAPEAKPQSVVARLTDEAPPALSMYDVGSLTPERKHMQEEEAGRDKKPFEVMLVEDWASSMPAMQPSEGNWVTVFGFVGAQRETVLSYFKKLGIVEESELGQGNWMHLKYSTLWAAQKALAKNGTILSGSCMLGVIPTSRAIEQVSHAAESFMSPIKKESIKRDIPKDQDIFIRSNLFSPMVRNAPDQRHPSSHPEADIPVPPESIVTKALGYVFGW